MYLNQHSPEPQPQPTEAKQKHQLMRDLASELAKRTGKPWCHAPGVGNGLCIDRGGYRIIFESSSLLRDRGRHNLRVEMFNRLSMLQRHEEVREAWPQVKLTKSAAAIANQLQRDGTLERMEQRRKLLDDQEERRHQENTAANAGADYIARDSPWLRVEPASGEFGLAHVKGTTGSSIEMGYASTNVYRKPGLVNLALLNIPLKTARKIAQLIELEATAQLIDQADDE